MTQVTGILCQIATSNVSGAGTDGNVFLGLGGREFRLDSSADDFEKGTLREYILGVGPIEPNPSSLQIRANNPKLNDPRLGFPLDTGNLDSLPKYIRFEPESPQDDRWNVSFAAALVYSNQFVVAYLVPESFHDLWLSSLSGKVLHLTAEFRVEAQALNFARERAAKSAG